MALCENGYKCFGGELRGAVEGDRLQGTGRLAKDLAAIAKDGRGAGEQQLLDPVPAHRFKDFHRGQERQPQVQRAVVVSPGDVRIGGEMKDGFETRVGEQAVQRIAMQDVEFVEMKPVARAEMFDVLLAAEVQVIDAPHLVAARQQGVAEMAADEAGSARNQNPHADPREFKGSRGEF